MLKRQEAIAAVSARNQIVNGAVTMVEMSLERLQSKGTVKFDQESKAHMVSNMLVVLCSEK